jgi:hypothetical protein
VADLVYDSLLDDASAPRAEADQGPANHVDLTAPGGAGDGSGSQLLRRLRFATDQDNLVLTAESTAEKVHLSVQLDPVAPAASRVLVRGSHGSAEATLDRAGYAEMDIPSGLVSVLVCAAAEGDDLLQTAWVRL